MSKYEKLSIVLSIIAIVIPTIVIPILKYFHNKFFKSTKLKHYINGRASLYFNLSGSYIEIDGVYEAQRNSTFIKKVTLQITRSTDNQKMNLQWSTFISPVNQRLLGNYSSTFETAHPFRIENDSITCAFVEYADADGSANRTLNPLHVNLAKTVEELFQTSTTLDEAKEKYVATNEYISLKNEAMGFFYWKIGKYTVELQTKYENKLATFKYEFEVNETTNSDLIFNFEEMLLTPLYNRYGLPTNKKAVLVELREVP